MLRNATALALVLTSGTALAQEVNQADDEWWTSAQDVLQQKLGQQPNTNTAKNVILFVGDGMGIPTNYAIRLYQGQQEGGFGDENMLPYEEYPHVALVKTYNTNAQTPDSAPTASALNSGVKSKFTTTGVSDAVVATDCSTYSPEVELTLLSDIVTDMGKSVGIVSTARLTHATGSAVYVHTVDRDWEDAVPEGCDQPDIASQLITAMEDGRVDLAMGGGRRHFMPEGTDTEEGGTGTRADGRNLVEEAQSAGAQYAWNDETVGQLTLDGTPILALFEDSHMQYEHDRAGEPSLAEMTEMAITSLQTNEEGFYLMVEGGRIDHGNHAGNLHRAVTDGVAMAEAVAMADEMTNDEDTLIIVTADHSHALIFNGYCGRGSPITGLCYGIDNANLQHTGEPELAADGKPYTVAGYLNGAGSVLIEQPGGEYFGARPSVTNEEATDSDYLQQALVPMGSETHSGEDVAAWAKGPFAHLVDGVVEQNYLFHVMNHAVQPTAE